MTLYRATHGQSTGAGFGQLTRAKTVIAIILITIYHLYFLHLCKKKLEVMRIYPSSTPQEKDDFGKGIIFIYLFPIIKTILVSYVFHSVSLQKLGFDIAIGIAAFIFALFSNRSYPSPVYYFLGYHYHTISTSENKNFTLISKKKHFRNKNQVKNVIMVFDDMLLDLSDVKE